MTGAHGRSPRLSRLADAVLHAGFVGTVPPAWLMRRLEHGLGGVVLFGRNVEGGEQVAALTGMLRQANPDVTVAVDEETGVVTRLEAYTGSTRPGAYALGAVDDVALTEAVAEDLGWTMREAGLTLNYAPDADVNSNPDNPVIGARSFGADPHRVARHTEAWIRGQQRAGVAACAKHFPGHGDTSTDSHLEAAVVTASRNELTARELHPFRAAIAAGVRAVMIGHLLVPALDPRSPATASRAVITGLLREELGFTGLAITDAIEMRAATIRYGLPGAAVRALAAGADIVCVGGEHADESTATLLRDAIVDAVTAGHLSERRLAEAGGRAAELARWSSTYAGGRPPRRDGTIGMAAARRAVRVTTRGADPALPLRTAPHVVELSAGMSPVAGREPPPDLGHLMARVRPGTTAVRLAMADVRDGRWQHEVLAAAGDRPLVVVVRDARRHAWISDALTVLESARPECVVVETGLVGHPRGAVYLSTHGSSLACRQAAVEVLVGRVS
ncbi:glycoside hydrolase family 3 protein [Krasilnikovia sp. MM14-A1004]|uniref:glycoside hydrolase family 3 protein n=1 Tax=Krasilnikovia sp. MM14-A1004 TaxID=3373541 RepID=UPI00399C872E